MKIGIPRDSLENEHRVALVPGVLAPLSKRGCKFIVETQAGLAAGYPDDLYREKGAQIVGNSDEVFAMADVITQVNTYGNNPKSRDLARMRPGLVILGLSDPLSATDRVQEIAGTGTQAFGMELIPRITRAQSMDVLSSMATVAGYKAVLLAAGRLPRMFPMLMTAAGTVSPARVFVIGAGVAGLQAIATAKRLGALIHAYDVRPAVKEQVQSVGAKFVELELQTQDSEDKGGYAKAQGEEFLRKQRELMAKVVQQSDVVITTAAIPGRKSPVLITEEMLRGMPPGSVVVDLAAERGGNCEVTKADEEVLAHGVTVLGPVNLPSTVPYHASQMYSKNMATLLAHLIDKEGNLSLDLSDEITAGTLMCSEGEVIHPRLRDILGLPAAEGPKQEAAK